MEDGLLEFDAHAPDSERLHGVFRAAHSIKGGAGAFGFTCLQDTTHRLENLLDRARHGDLMLDAPLVNLCFETRDVLAGQIDAGRAGVAPDEQIAAAICTRLEAAVDNNSRASAAEVGPSEASQEQAFEVSVVSQSKSQITALQRLLVVTVRTVTKKDQAALTDELALFGDIKASSYDNGTLSVRLVTDEACVNIEAVLCFVVDDEQITIEETPAKRDSSALPDAAPGTGSPLDHAAPTQDPAPAEAVEQASPASPATGFERADRPARAGASSKVGRPASHAAGGESGTLRVTTDKIDSVNSRAPCTRACVSSVWAGKWKRPPRPAKPVQEAVEQRANALDARWNEWFAAPIELADARDLVADTRAYFRWVPEQTQATHAELHKIMMAQDFQDLTGQVINKLVDVIRRIEYQLVDVLLENMSDEHARARKDSRRDAADNRAPLDGPRIKPDAADVVTDQDQVDDLLDSLGF